MRRAERIKNNKILLAYGKRICSVCEDTKDLKEFPYQGPKLGFYGKCRDCLNKEMYLSYQEERREWNRKRKEREEQAKNDKIDTLFK